MNQIKSQKYVTNHEMNLSESQKWEELKTTKKFENKSP